MYHSTMHHYPHTPQVIYYITSHLDLFSFVLYNYFRFFSLMMS